MRLFVISNRLPVTLVKKEGQLTLQVSSGGLVSGLGSYLESFSQPHTAARDYLWMGWPGLDLCGEDKKYWQVKFLEQCRSYPVFLPEEEMEHFYHGFCNKTLWPLFHYFPSYTSFEESTWEQYKKINEKFCEEALHAIRPDDMVWIHDYHFMLLPKLIREKRPDQRIGFFLHTPFPSYEIFRLLPPRWRVAILEGILGSDVIGFHTNDYTQYFLRCCLRILGVEHNMGQMVVGERLVTADTFPMGIDYQKYHEASAIPAIEQEKQLFKKTVGDLKVVLSLDRLDYTKGILNRLLGYETFLERNPEWLKKVVLVLVLIPSRIGVDQYQGMKTQIDSQIGKINGRFGALDWTPIVYQYKSLSFSELMAFYGGSDVALVTPLRDGMNLVAKEYIASRTEQTGVLILSEMAGSAFEMGEALIINPTTKEEIADSLKAALDMPVEEQKKRNQVLQSRLKAYDIVRWAEDFIQKISESALRQNQFNAKIFKPAMQEQVLKKYHQAHKRLLLLDYDGTLVSYTARPGMSQPTPELLSLLGRLAVTPGVELAILSGRPRETLDLWLKELPIHLVAEHGVWLKPKNGEWKLIKALRDDWKSQILPILQVFADRLPRSFVEEKEYSLVWHYRLADPEQAALREKELVDSLIHLTATTDLQVMQGRKIIEIKNSGVSKGNAAIQFMGRGDYDFILAIGDDTTDEELFQALPNEAVTIRVGLGSTHARYNMSHSLEVLAFLEQLIL